MRFTIKQHSIFPAAFWLLVVLLGLGILRNVQKAYAQGGAGSSVVLQEVLTSKTGAKTLGGLYTFAARADGSSAVIASTQAGSVEAPTRMVRLASGTQGYVSDSRRLKSTAPISAEANPSLAQNLRVASSRCAIGTETTLGEEQMSGYRAEHVSGYGRTAWFALDYGCALVGEHFDYPDGQKSDKHLLLLRAGEPDAGLFAIPADYQEQPLSVLLNRHE